MRVTTGQLILTGTMLCLSLFGCNLPKAGGKLNMSGTIIAATLGYLQTSAASAQTAEVIVYTSTSEFAPSATASRTQTPKNPLVTIDTLCWAGPGNAYEVVSAVRERSRLVLLGIGTIPGWYIVRNPIYRDPCWIQATALQIDPGFDLSGLPYVSPPATPTPTEHDTPVPTGTP